jgi:hypothetical protein
MRKPSARKPGQSSRPEAAQSNQPPAGRNPHLYAQTRKILSQHYRAKYSMRQGRGGRKP